jgi:hypothetical protein
MNAAATLANNLLTAYKNAYGIKVEQKNLKLMAIRSQYPGYRMFDFEHPYHDMEEVTKAAEKHIKQMIKSVMDIEIDGSTVRKELEKIKVFAILSSKPVDEYVTKLLKW